MSPFWRDPSLEPIVGPDGILYYPTQHLPTCYHCGEAEHLGSNCLRLRLHDQEKPAVQQTSTPTHSYFSNSQPARHIHAEYLRSEPLPRVTKITDKQVTMIEAVENRQEDLIQDITKDLSRSNEEDSVLDRNKPMTVEALALLIDQKDDSNSSETTEISEN